jgi:hypothetical protein
VSSSRASTFLFSMSVSLAIIAVARWVSADSRLRQPISPMVTTAARVRIDPAISDSMLAHAAELTVENDLFRLSNSPPDVRFDPGVGVTVVQSGPSSSVAARPILALKAIVGGPPWHAVIDGIPGQPSGTLARTGSRFDALLIRSITRDSVVIQGADTAWVLSFSRRQ